MWNASAIEPAGQIQDFPLQTVRGERMGSSNLGAAYLFTQQKEQQM
jgi:hypothetical protein